MKFQFLNPTLHGLLDYAAAAGLILLPVILGFDGLSLWLSIAGGLGLIGYSLITDYAYGAASFVPFKAHLILDLSAAVAFIAAPFVFGWSGLVAGYYFVMAAGVVLVVALTDTKAETVSVEPVTEAG